jgi:hypothetical protein
MIKSRLGRLLSLQGSCSRTAGVAGSRELIDEIRASLEQQFGLSNLYEDHAANHQPEPNILAE